MGVPTERGTVEVYTCLELHFFLFSCQFSLPYINGIFKHDYASIFIFYFYFIAFFHTMHINRIFFKTKLFSYFHLYIFHFYLKVLSVLFWHSLNVFTSKKSIGPVVKCNTRLNLQFNQVERMVLIIVQLLVKWIAIWCLFYSFCNLKN